MELLYVTIVVAYLLLASEWHRGRKKPVQWWNDSSRWWQCPVCESRFLNVNSSNYLCPKCHGSAMAHEESAGLGIYLPVGDLFPGDLFYEPMEYGDCEIVAMGPSDVKAKVRETGHIVSAPASARVYHKASGLK